MSTTSNQPSADNLHYSSVVDRKKATIKPHVFCKVCVINSCSKDRFGIIQTRSEMSHFSLNRGSTDDNIYLIEPISQCFHSKFLLFHLSGASLIHQWRGVLFFGTCRFHTTTSQSVQTRQVLQRLTDEWVGTFCSMSNCCRLSYTLFEVVKKKDM